MKDIYSLEVKITNKKELTFLEKRLLKIQSIVNDLRKKGVKLDITLNHREVISVNAKDIIDKQRQVEIFGK